jgi:hypothetical protein
MDLISAVFTNTFQDHNIIYNRMIDVFSRAINRLGKKERQLHKQSVYFVAIIKSGNYIKQQYQDVNKYK